jgi:hypothetical protein
LPDFYVACYLSGDTCSNAHVQAFSVCKAPAKNAVSDFK